MQLKKKIKGLIKLKSCTFIYYISNNQIQLFECFIIIIAHYFKLFSLSTPPWFHHIFPLSPFSPILPNHSE